jgi:hypothetical protein
MRKRTETCDNIELSYAERAIVKMLTRLVPEHPALLQCIERIEAGEHLAPRTEGRKTVVMARAYIEAMLKEASHE